MISVLYVDDDENLLDIGKKFLEKTDSVIVDTALSAQQGLEKITAGHYDLIVSDYQMPGMDGIGFLKQVRNNFGDLPFILFTGRGREEIVIEALNNGADFYLQKGGPPKAQFAELIHKIHIAVDHHRASERIRSLNRLYSVLSAANKAIVRIHNKSDFFSEICRILVETGGFRMAWIGLADPEQKLINPVASSGYVKGYLKSAYISTEDLPRGRGPTGTAFREGKYNFSNDITRDPLMEPWRNNALQRGYLANGAFPFALGTKNAGVLSVYAPVTGFFDEQIVALMEELAFDISFALKTIDEKDGQKAAESALQASEQRFHSLYTKMTEGSALHELTYDEKGVPFDYIIIETNPAFESQLGISRDAVIGKTSREAYGVSEPPYFEICTRVALTGEPYFFETFFPPLGRYLSISAFCPSRGRFATIFEDITKRKQTEEALRAREERYRSIVENAPVGIFHCLPEGKIIDVNPAYARIFGYDSPEEFLEVANRNGIAETIYMVPDRRSMIVRNILESGEWQTYENLYQRKDGSIIHGLLKLRSYSNLAGGWQELEGFIIDITDSIHAEETLRESEEKYRSLYQNSALGIFHSTLDGKFIDVNPALANMLGYDSPEEVIRSITSIAGQIYAEPPQYDNVAAAALDAGGIVSKENHYRRRDGTQWYGKLHLRIVPELRGKPSHYEGFVEDISDVKEAEEATQLAERKLKLLSGSILHDINNQLSMLQANLLILGNKVTDPAYDQIISSITEAGQRISSAIQVARTYEGLGISGPVWQDTSALVETAARDVALSPVQLKNDIPAGSDVFADPLIVRVFFNLMDNAVRYGGKITTIWFSLEESEEDHIIVYEDDGIGVPADDKEIIFDRGFGRNTGFGLFLVREILAITGITIRENGVPGSGARFEIRVPQGRYRFVLSK
jgi:PAS domain S-box-containing protein